MYLIGMIVLLNLSGQAFAQSSAERPTRASEAVEALESSEWVRFEDGLSHLRVVTALGTRLSAFKVSHKEFKFSVVTQNDPGGERIRSMVERNQATLGVNGGFFGIKPDNGELFPVGLLIDDGLAQSSAWSKIGGYLAFTQDGTPQILPTSSGVPKWAKEAIQSKPVLIEPGGLWAMNTNHGDAEDRTIVCSLSDDESLILTVTGGGLTLFEAGWLLRSKAWGGFFDCDSAIALDGGGSTQFFFSDRSDLTITGLTPVHNGLLVTRRK